MILVLGGTSEARALAQALTAQGISVLSSLAGRVRNPARPAGDVRIGGFGGAEGLATFLLDSGVNAVVDATHPFAARMSANAAAACRRTGIPLLRLSRPSWAERPLASSWTWVDDHDSAAAAATSLGRRVFLTTGRQTLTHFTPMRAEIVVVRLLERHDGDDALPPTWVILLDRGPFDVRAERSLMQDFAIDVLVTKDSGGDLTGAKLEAAAELGIAVVIVRRPPTADGVPEVTDVAGASAWAASRVRSG